STPTRGRAMKDPQRIEFGVYLPQLQLDFDTIRARVRAADELGFDTAWFYDHLYPPGLPDVPGFEGWTLVSALATQTQRIRRGDRDGADPAGAARRRHRLPPPRRARADGDHARRDQRRPPRGRPRHRVESRRIRAVRAPVPRPRDAQRAARRGSRGDRAAVH